MTTGRVATGNPVTVVDAGDAAAIEKRVLGEVTAILHDVIGEENLIDLEITMETVFSSDLEMESIEFVALSERIRERYADAVDFIGFLAEMDIDDIINMQVGQVVRFIAGSVAGHRGDGPGPWVAQGESGG